MGVIMYSFEKFLNSVKEKSQLEIYDATIQEYHRLEKQLINKQKREQARQTGIDLYMKKLKGLMFFILNHHKPDSLSNYEFQLLKPLVQRFIDEKLYKPEAIKIFE